MVESENSGWSVPMADVDDYWYADNGEGRYGSHQEDNGGVPITHDR